MTRANVWKGLLGTLLFAGLSIIGGQMALAGVNGWTSLGPPGFNSEAYFYVRALAINPAMPSTLYVGTDGGVFKSTDGGGTWNAINTGLSKLSALHTVAIDLSRPSTLYVGGTGAFASTDGGTSWNPINTGLTDSSGDPLGIIVLAVAPTTPSTLYAATVQGVFESTDGGASWTPSNTGLTGSSGKPLVARVLVIDPTAPNTLYVGTNTVGLFKSTDGGGTWNPISTGLNSLLWIQALAIAPSAPSILYVWALDPSTGTTGPFRSTDSGSSWSPGAAPFDANPGIHALAVDPSTPSTVYAATVQGVFESIDGGGSWRDLSAGLTSLMIEALIIDPGTPTTLYAGTGGAGVFSLQQANSCVGDCSGMDTVTVSDLITLVNIALGNTEPSECENGLPSSGGVDIAVVINAVDNAMNGCGAG